MLDNVTVSYSEPQESVPARPKKLSHADIVSLRAILKKTPQAVGLDADRWSPDRISLLLRQRFQLGYSAKHAVRMLRRQGLRIEFKRAREPRLRSAEIAELSALLQQAPVELGLSDDIWSRARLAQLIEEKFRVRYSPQYAARLVRMLGLNLTLARRKRRLQREQVEQLKALLLASPGAAGLQGHSWTRSSVAELIFKRFGVRYHSRSISRVLRRWRIDPPEASTAERSVAFTATDIGELRNALARTPQDVGLEGQIWTRRQIALFLERRFGVRYSACTLNRLLTRLDVNATHRATRGGTSRLNRSQIQELARALQTLPVRAAPYNGWTRKEVVRLIHRKFHINYAPTSIPRLLRRLGLRPVVSESRPVVAALPDRSANIARQVI